MSLRYHVQEIMKINPVPAQWPRMIVCAFATSFPLIIGVLTDQLPISIFGALTGFLLVLNDHMGSLGHRLWVITLTFLILAAGLFIGISTGQHKPLFIPLLLFATYWVGLMGGQGDEFGRAILFSIFQMLAGAYAAGLKEYAGAVGLYSLIGYLCVVGMLTLLVFLRRHTPNPFARVRSTIRNSLTKERGRHLYALCYTLAVLGSLLLVDYFKINHGYWAVGTVLIIMRPSLTQSIYRLIQRLFGTVLGVLVAEALIITIHSPWPAIAVTAFVSFWGPWSLSRSYMWGSAVVSVMILLLLDMPHLEYGDLNTPVLRLAATGLGCLVSLAGALLANPRALFKKNVD
ncbi:hypothetical protein D3C87_1149440 [compost metagenome]